MKPTSVPSTAHMSAVVLSKPINFSLFEYGGNQMKPVNLDVVEPLIFMLLVVDVKYPELAVSHH